MVGPSGHVCALPFAYPLVPQVLCPVAGYDPGGWHAALAISEYPEVVPPAIVVRASYPGANPKTIAETVASPLEQAVNGVEDSLYMFSQATSDGVMNLTVTFKLGTDIGKAQVQVQNRVSQALPKRPDEVRQLGVTTTKQSPDLTMVVHLFSPGGRYDEVYLRN